MLVFNLAPVFTVRGIHSPLGFLMKAGISRHSASSLLDKSIRSVSILHLEILCRTLVCEPNDLLQWIPDKNDFLPKTHPLYKLKPDPVKGISEVISDKSFQELKSITRSINDKTIPES